LLTSSRYVVSAVGYLCIQGPPRESVAWDSNHYNVNIEKNRSVAPARQCPWAGDLRREALWRGNFTVFASASENEALNAKSSSGRVVCKAVSALCSVQQVLKMHPCSVMLSTFYPLFLSTFQKLPLQPKRLDPRFHTQCIYHIARKKTRYRV
jgi:hypothetical protein